jgi:hypothetical protein
MYVVSFNTLYSMGIEREYSYSHQNDEVRQMYPFIKRKGDWINSSPEYIYKLIYRPAYSMAWQTQYVLSIMYTKKFNRSDDSEKSKQIFHRMDKITDREFTTVEFNNIGDDIFIHPKIGRAFSEPWHTDK